MTSNNLLILNFHSIYRPETLGQRHFDPKFSVSAIQLENYFRILQRKKIQCCAWNDLKLDVSSNQLNVALSFDDGHPSDYEIVVPLLKKYKLDACFFVVGKIIENDKEARNRVREIHRQGFTIGSHGLTHQKMTLLSKNEQFHELQESKRIIEACIDEEIYFLAFPEGRYNRQLIDLGQKAGYLKMFTTNAEWNKLNSDSLQLNRWSIKNSTSVSFFEKIVSGHFLCRKYLTILSKSKRQMLNLKDKLFNT